MNPAVILGLTLMVASSADDDAIRANRLRYLTALKCVSGTVQPSVDETGRSLIRVSMYLDRDYYLIIRDGDALLLKPVPSISPGRLPKLEFESGEETGEATAETRSFAREMGMPLDIRTGLIEYSGTMKLTAEQARNGFEAYVHLVLSRNPFGMGHFRRRIRFEPLRPDLDWK